MTATGTVKRFDSEKGYGFITLDDPEAGDVFVHYTGIAGSGFRELAAGQKVSCTITEGKKGPQAEDVRILTT